MIFDIATPIIDIGMYGSQLFYVSRNPRNVGPLLLRPAKQKLIISRLHGLNDACVAAKGDGFSQGLEDRRHGHVGICWYLLDMDVNQQIGGKAPKWMVKIVENPSKTDDLGGKNHYFWFNTHILEPI